MTDVTLNMLDGPSVNTEAFGNRFAVYESECKDYKLREILCNVVRRLDGVRAVLNDGDSRTVLFLADTGEETAERIRDAVSAQSEDVVVRRVFAGDVDTVDAIRLLMNSLTSIEGEEGLVVSNAAGQCHIVHKFNGGRKNPHQIVCLSFSVSPSKGSQGDVVLSCGVVSYTNIRFRKPTHVKNGEMYDEYSMEFNQKYPFETFAQYCCENGRILPAPEGYKGPRFIRRGLIVNGNETRNRVDYLNFDSREKLSRTRSAVIARLLRTFNLSYGDIVTLRFISTEVDRRNLSNKYDDDEARIASILGGEVLLYDAVGDSAKAGMIVDQCRKQKVDVKIADGSKSRMPTIRMVNDIGAVPKEEDKYGKDKIGIVQHIKVGSVDEDTIETVVRSVLKELAIKCDVEYGRIRTFDWSSLGFERVVEFGMPIAYNQKDRKVEQVGILTVDLNGGLSFRAVSFTSLDAPCWAVHLFEGGYELVVASGTDVMGIFMTDIFPVPDVEAIAEYMRGNVKANRTERFGFRSAEIKDQYLAEATDLNWFERAGKFYYYVGLIGQGMRTSVPNASIVRRVDAIKGSLFIEKLLPTIEVIFIRNKQSTVLPFPFKYLRECARIAGYDLDGKRPFDSGTSESKEKS